MYEIYENNGVKVTMYSYDDCLAERMFNGKNLIWISRNDVEDFAKEFVELMNKYIN